MNKQTQWLRSSFIGVLAVALAVAGCRSNALDDLSDTDSQVFITNRDPQADFSQYRTFSLPDSVVVLSGNRSARSLAPTEQTVINRVAEQLTSRGFRRVARGQAADLGVSVFRVVDNFVGVTQVPFDPFFMDYWGFGGFGPGVGGFSPFFPDTFQFYQVQDTYWSIQAVDLKNAPQPGSSTAQNNLRVLYEADIRGNGIFDQASAATLVDAVFAQSPFLRTTP